MAEEKKENWYCALWRLQLIIYYYFWIVVVEIVVVISVPKEIKRIEGHGNDQVSYLMNCQSIESNWLGIWPFWLYGYTVELPHIQTHDDKIDYVIHKVEEKIAVAKIIIKKKEDLPSSRVYHLILVNLV